MKYQEALYELCVDHMSALVNKAELASVEDRANAGSGAAVETANTDPGFPSEAHGGGEEKRPSAEPPKDSQNDAKNEPKKNPQNEPKNEPTHGERPGDEAQLSAKQRGLTLSVSFDEDVHYRRGGSTGDEVGDGRVVDADSLGRKEKPELQRQVSSFESSGAESSASAAGGEEHSTIRAFLLPEEEQVKTCMKASFVAEIVNVAFGFAPQRL